MPIGFRVFTKRDLPSREIVEGFKTIPAANIADCMSRLSAMSSQIRRMTEKITENMVGVALTVRVRSGDNLMIHMALNIAGEGDVLVVSNDGAQNQSLLGEIMVAYAVHKRISGIVLDGPIRDVDSVYSMGLPIYATGSTPGGPFKDGPGEINAPISCGNVPVNPGDIIVGDSDGVIVIPKNDGPVLLETAKKFSALDSNKLTAAMSGRAERDWVNKSLREKGCEIVEDIYKL